VQRHAEDESIVKGMQPADEKSALMKQLRYKAVEQKALSSP